jgi:hypothetical protein
MRHSVERWEPIALANGRPKATRLLVEVEDKEGAARSLDHERLLEKRPIELLVELNHDSLALALDARHIS